MASVPFRAVQIPSRAVDAQPIGVSDLSLTALGIIQAVSDIIWAALESIGQVVAFGLLFTRSARRWMNREDETRSCVRSLNDPRK
jgi:hypothetical protein